MDDVISLVLSVLVLVSSIVVRPSRAACPREWVIMGGVNDRGLFVCQPERVGCETCDLYQPPGFIAGRIYCAPGLTPAQTRYSDGATCSHQPRW